MFGFDPAMGSAIGSHEFEIGKAAQRKTNAGDGKAATPQAEKTTPQSKESR